MPRLKRNYTSKKARSVLKKDESINSTMMDCNSKTIDNNYLKLKIWEAEVKSRMKLAQKQLSDMQNEKIQLLENKFRTALMALPKNVLETVIDIKSKDVRSAFHGAQDGTVQGIHKPLSVIKKTINRRSKSASNTKHSCRPFRKTSRIRSSSADMFKTPKGKVRLSSIMTKKKYTVSKPSKSENSGLRVKRIMRPDEEAISTSGSPLYVTPLCSLGAPHVNIPLPGGVVLNIEPKSSKLPMEVPSLDAKTKNQIKLLCDQLNNLF